MNESKGSYRKNLLKTSVEQIEGNERSYPYLYPIGDLAMGDDGVRNKKCKNDTKIIIIIIIYIIYI
jgi:hypothetical protein